MDITAWLYEDVPNEAFKVEKLTIKCFAVGGGFQLPNLWNGSNGKEGVKEVLK